ncbi:hypothetical protein ACJRO7_015322 [Eucalyptus globulus]|uniref:Secreted protein n=1 Tax=Eucalyptus globulus TaxID=34317 RepID=A0ABD3L367_EUCGL
MQELAWVALMFTGFAERCWIPLGLLSYWADSGHGMATRWSRWNTLLELRACDGSTRNPRGRPRSVLGGAASGARQDRGRLEWINCSREGLQGWDEKRRPPFLFG